MTARFASPRHEPHAAKKKSFLQQLGPGLITGAADDDPSGIATYSQAGAMLGFGLLWTMVLCLPLMAAIQEISARLGRITGCGISANIKKYYSPWLLYPLVLLLALANIFNIGADIGAMGAALHDLAGGPAVLFATMIAIGCVLLQMFSNYWQFSRILKWISLALLCYVIAVFVVHPSIKAVILGTFLPKVPLHGKAFSMVVAVLGTTISPYLFFWQCALETEEIRASDREPLIDHPKQASGAFRRIRTDTYAGMFVSNFIAYCIMLTCGATLHPNGITDIQTAEQAGEALRPIAGRMAEWLFACGIIGTGLMAVPVLTGSVGYALADAFRWPAGIGRKPARARGFYVVVILTTLLGLSINFPVVQKFTHLTPMQALVWSAVFNGIAAVPIMVVMMLLCHKKEVIGRFTRTFGALRLLGWIATASMFLAVIGMFVTWKS